MGAKTNQDILQKFTAKVAQALLYEKIVTRIKQFLRVDENVSINELEELVNQQLSRKFF